jgi:trans-aconitate methyltransferase
MLERGRLAASGVALKEHLRFREADLNSWTASWDCDAAIANQSLHHIVNLEGLFSQVEVFLRPGGVFIISGRDRSKRPSTLARGSRNGS